MGEVSSMSNTDNITLSINKNHLKEVVVSNLSSEMLTEKLKQNNLPVEEDLLKQINFKETEIKLLENKIVDLQNTILILENDLELNILQNIETIIKQEEFLLEVNQVISNLEMKNENYQASIIKQTKELKKINEKYNKLKKSKLGNIVIKYWDMRRKIKK
ncbi:hypothetical protein [Gottfriedia solisilvae]|uniref:Uncharacterized protein n=1 Tax=Gottfriedia solisilvae TaxID=1516104 RepID=A0A8J3EZY4_9BACI|nr:hypothetical protein [Gottfriedia solisilvae]GGI17435.1 hypothetical protein GCM10007380_37930 [Gottfriedia solisilvae]